MKKILKYAGICLLTVIIAAAGLVGYLTITEYRPADIQPAERIVLNGGAKAGRELILCTWNIGYGGLGKESDFFMDGGSMVNPPSAEISQKNLSGIQDYMEENPADIWLLQEVDAGSSRSDNVDQFERLRSVFDHSGVFACNYKCGFVPFPLPPIGKVQSGLAVMTSLGLSADAQRISLHCPYSWPVSTANLKRCLLTARIPVEGTDKELVIINLHMEAYESGEGRIIQTRQLTELMSREYAKGNYVIAGGDFNQSFPGTRDTYPIKNEEMWTPGILEENALPAGWQYAFDDSTATCRLLDAPLSQQTQLYVIDGFIVSPNVELKEISTADMGFECSDHNPVRMAVVLK